MAKFNFNSKIVSRFVAHLEGEEIELEIAKLNITEILALAREGEALKASIEAEGGKLTPEAHTSLLDTLCGLIVGVHDLTDEQDQEVDWDRLSANARMSLLAHVDVGDLLDIFVKASEIGRLKADEKKK